MSDRPPLIGLTGAIGAGKSTVLRAFAVRGCACLSADTIVHALYHRGRVRDALVARLGADVLGADGEVDRVAVARHVFGDPEALAWLEGLLHPLVEAEMRTWVDEARTQDPPPPLVVYESPLLFEAGLRARFDRVLVVTAPDDVRRARVSARGGLAALEAREQRMWAPEERAAAADDVIANDGDERALQAQVDAYIARYAAP